MAQTKKEIGDRGKDSEKDVQKHLDKLNDQVLPFAYSRLADARSAGGRMSATLCDFLWWWKPLKESWQISGLLEVKCTSHDSRIAKDKLAQLPRMRKVCGAGAVGLVLVFHSNTELWRAIPLNFFDGDIPPSWDLSALPTFATVAEALDSTNLFPKLKG